MQLLVLVGIFAITVSATPAERFQQRLPQPIEIIDQAPPPTSLEGLWDESLVVARVKIQSATTHELFRRPDVPPRIVTEHGAVVLESMKGSTVQAGETITIVLPVGQVEEAGSTRKAKSAGIKRFDVGEELVVFLKFWPAAQGYTLAYGSVGFYGLDHADVALPPAARKWVMFGRTRQAIPKGEFLGIIRSLQKRPAKH